MEGQVDDVDAERDGNHGPSTAALPFIDGSVITVVVVVGRVIVRGESASSCCCCCEAEEDKLALGWLSWVWCWLDRTKRSEARSGGSRRRTVRFRGKGAERDARRGREAANCDAGRRRGDRECVPRCEQHPRPKRLAPWSFDAGKRKLVNALHRRHHHPTTATKPKRLSGAAPDRW